MEDVKEKFLEAVKDHSIKIIFDQGINKHIRFSKNGSSIYQFDLITWPGYLCIAGDCGTYVFSRVMDMFEFFRRDKLAINPHYWGQKLESVCKVGGFEHYSEDKFRERVKEYFDEHCEATGNHESCNKELWEEIEENVLEYADNEQNAYSAVSEFLHDGFAFHDFFDGGGTEEYSFNYLFCLFAIVWGIAKYDEFKERE